MYNQPCRGRDRKITKSAETILARAQLSDSVAHRAGRGSVRSKYEPCSSHRIAQHAGQPLPLLVCVGNRAAARSRRPAPCLLERNSQVRQNARRHQTRSTNARPAVNADSLSVANLVSQADPPTADRIPRLEKSKARRLPDQPAHIESSGFRPSAGYVR